MAGSQTSTTTPATASPPAPFDTDFAAFAASLELGMVAVYEVAIAKLTGNNVVLASRFRDHHQEHARLYTTLAAGKATNAPNPAFSAMMLPAIQAVTDEPNALMTLFNVENQMAETYAYALTALAGTEFCRHTVTTLPVESGHAAALGAALALPLDALFLTGPFVNASVGDGTDARRGFDMALFPVS